VWLFFRLDRILRETVAKVLHAPSAARGTESVQTVRKTSLSTGLKFFDVEITGGGKVTETTNRSVPFLEAFGELESKPYWEFMRTPSRVSVASSDSP